MVYPRVVYHLKFAMLTPVGQRKLTRITKLATLVSFALACVASAFAFYLFILPSLVSRYTSLSGYDVLLSNRLWVLLPSLYGAFAEFFILSLAVVFSVLFVMLHLDRPLFRSVFARNRLQGLLLKTLSIGVVASFLMLAIDFDSIIDFLRHFGDDLLMTHRNITHHAEFWLYGTGFLFLAFLLISMELASKKQLRSSSE